MSDQVDSRAREVKWLMTDAKRSVLQAGGTQSPELRAHGVYGYHHRQAKGGVLSAFNGELDQPVTGLYVLGNGYRAYQPTLMRFFSPDSFSPFGAGGINAYAYVADDPVNGSDPSGHEGIFPKFGVYVGRVRDNVDFTAFMAPHPVHANEQAITVHAHGRPGLIRSRRGLLNGEQVVGDLAGAGFDINNHDIHFISCHSAAPSRTGEPSVIQQAHNITQRGVIGYSQQVFVFNRDVWPLRQLGLTTTVVLQRQGMLYTQDGFNYQQVSVGVSSIRSSARQGENGALDHVDQGLQWVVSGWD
ncbi:RHS repeat-associated core domain-containing protein [Pseudomonas sp. CCOS 191]|uniref:RHS repeat-associated core domain-containing protein n=1 Tax=Pseudomonas sp. CCOS 191 TaxID=1649877 RepID=UPI0006247FEA|nr:RHS repeat-associated core domain-containing protein [Pseudomonas sp. CCOS 191]CRI57467.1 hypothetical protein CCOS191_2931 [Pseudomonas sp. CCOS 191]